jgi:hypothetical protein
MRRQYSGNHGARPRAVRRSSHGAAASARLFMCAECHAQALICSCCDRGQIYCAGDCAARARRRTRRDAGRRYQTSRRGRLAHAERTRRYRVRCKNVTHHGSPPSPPDDLLSSGSPAIASDASPAVRTTGRGVYPVGRPRRDLPATARNIPLTLYNPGYGVVGGLSGATTGHGGLGPRSVREARPQLQRQTTLWRAIWTRPISRHSRPWQERQSAG